VSFAAPICTISTTPKPRRRPCGSCGELVRRVGEDGAHRDVLEEEFEVAGEAVEEEVHAAEAAGGVEVLDEAEAGVAVLLHEVLHAAVAEVFEPFGEELARGLVAAPEGVARDAQQRAQVFVEAQGVVALDAYVVEEPRAVEGRLEDVRQRDGRLLEAVAQEVVRVLETRARLGEVVAGAGQNPLGHGPQLVPQREARPLQLLGELGGQLRALAEGVEAAGRRQHFRAYHVEEKERLVRRAAGAHGRAHGVEVAEQAVEVVEDPAEELAYFSVFDSRDERAELRLQDRRPPYSGE
jgi:hypothetical protein